MNWNPFKKSKLSEEQQRKLDRVEQELKLVLKSAKDHIVADAKIMQLHELEIAIGCLQLQYEQTVQRAMQDFMVTGVLPEGPMGEIIKASGQKILKQIPLQVTKGVVPKGPKIDLASAEKEFDDDSDMPSMKKVLH